MAEGKAPVFASGENYVRVTVGAFRRKAESEDYDRATRVEFAAMGYANRDGHAQFQAGQLARILAIAGKPASASEVSKAIARARHRGAIGCESRASCLVVDHRNVDQGKGRVGCAIHGLAHLPEWE